LTADSITNAFARNAIPFRGNRIQIAHLDADAFGRSCLVPYSVRAILRSRNLRGTRLDSLVFEFGNRLQRIASSAFYKLELHCVFLPQSVCSIGQFAFSCCLSLSCVHFGCQSSPWQLRPSTFSSCESLTVITIPASVRQIHNYAFAHCKCLCPVTFATGSNCWYIASGAFDYCPRLKSILLSPSVEVIDPILSFLFFFPLPHWSADDISHFCVENDCFISANGRQLIQYQLPRFDFFSWREDHNSLCGKFRAKRLTADSRFPVSILSQTSSCVLLLGVRFAAFCADPKFRLCALLMLLPWVP
jgi:hypothetical protein